MILVVAAILIIVYGFVELYLFTQWLASERGDDAEPEDDNIDPAIDVRKKQHGDYIYTSPIRSDDKEKDTYLWDVNISRVGGDGHQKNENTDEYDI